MSQSKIENLPIQDGRLTLSADLLPQEWTAPFWILWEADEPYMTLFPSTPDDSMLESVAESGSISVSNGAIELPLSFLETLADPNEVVTVRAEPNFVEIFGGRVWDALKGSFTSPDVFW